MSEIQTQMFPILGPILFSTNLQQQQNMDCLSFKENSKIRPYHTTF